REAGVRRAEEREEILARAVGPREAQERRQRVAHGRRAEPPPRLERVRDAEAGERRLERRAEAPGRRDDERAALRRDALAQEHEHFLRDELERVARAGALEEADGSRRRGPRLGSALEQRALEVDERRCDGSLILEAVGWKLGRPAVGERGQVVDGPAERRERDAARLVRQRDVDLGPPGERLEQRPPRGGQGPQPLGAEPLAPPRPPA